MLLEANGRAEVALEKTSLHRYLVSGKAELDRSFGAIPENIDDASDLRLQFAALRFDFDPISNLDSLLGDFQPQCRFSPEAPRAILEFREPEFSVGSVFTIAA